MKKKKKNKTREIDQLIKYMGKMIEKRFYLQ